MGFNRFYFWIIIRVALILISALLLSFFFRMDDKNMLNLVLILLLILQTFLLIKYIDKTNAELARFLIRFQAKDTAINYPIEKQQKNFQGIYLSFNKINKEMQKMRIENEQKTHYLNTIVNNLSIGILAFDDREKVELLNPVACRILNCEKFYFLNKLKEHHFEIYHAIKKATTLSQHLKKINTEDGLLNLIFRSNLIKIGKRNIHIISFQNINRELDHKELDSWQKLIRVLNHEIINSITPITTLSKTIQRYIHFDNKLKRVSDLNDEIVKDIAINAEIITERGKGLIDFIEVYKNITKSPKLNISKFNIAQTIKGVQQFYQQNFNEQQIKFESDVPANLELTADESLIKQILINVVKNALEALINEEDPYIRIKAYLSGEGNLLIKIEDNGVGIPENELDKIFIPFYSTKQNGSGIGLSLSRQIMHLHNGTISVSSHLGIETSFILRF